LALEKKNLATLGKYHFAAIENALAYLQKFNFQIEQKHNLDAKNAALLRALAIKRFSKFRRARQRVRTNVYVVVVDGVPLLLLLPGNTDKGSVG